MSSNIDAQFNGKYGGADDTIGVVIRVDSATNIISGDVYSKSRGRDGRIYFNRMFSFIVVNSNAETAPLGKFLLQDTRTRPR